MFLFGSVWLIMFVLAMTSIPFWARYRLGTFQVDELPKEVQTIVIMGGGAMPSESALMRLWYAVEEAQKNPQAKVLVAMPGVLADSSCALTGMYNYLLENGVGSERILVENKGVNTRSQALNCFRMVNEGKVKGPVMLISSPVHMKRSVLAFKKAGFSSIYGRPAFEDYIAVDLAFDDDELGGDKIIPDVGNSTLLRYQFWDYLHYEIELCREYTALLYYKLKGWI